MLYHQTNTVAQKQQIELQSKTVKLDELEKVGHIKKGSRIMSTVKPVLRGHLWDKEKVVF